MCFAESAKFPPFSRHMQLLCLICQIEIGSDMSHEVRELAVLGVSAEEILYVEGSHIFCLFCILFRWTASGAWQVYFGLPRLDSCDVRVCFSWEIDEYDMRGADAEKMLRDWGSQILLTSILHPLSLFVASCVRESRSNILIFWHSSTGSTNWDTRLFHP